MKYTRIKRAVKEFNSFPGAAIVTLSGNRVECTVGQSECYVDGYRVLASKLTSCEPEFYLTTEEIQEELQAIR